MAKIPRPLLREAIGVGEFYYSRPKAFWLIFLIGLTVMILAFYDLYRCKTLGGTPIVGVLGMGFGFFAIFLIMYQLDGRKK